jgi:hypothetical protein
MLICREKATSLNDMRDMLATLPQFQEMRDQFSLHLNLAEKCMEIFEEKKLLDVGLVEQVLLKIYSLLTSELCNWSYIRRQIPQNGSRRPGPPPSSSTPLVLPHLGFP